MPRPELLAWALVLLVAAACAGPQTGVPAPASDPTFERAVQVQAAERAPDLWARALEADARARQASDSASARDALTEARLWRQAAIADAERIAAQAQITEAQALAEQRAQALAELEAARRAAQAEATRLAAGRLALEEVARVLALAATEPRRRPSLDEAALRRGTGALVDRATLVSAAARRLGADPAVLDAVDARLERARARLETQPEVALREADRALFDAQAALGPVRGAQVDGAARQSLVDALRAAGFDPRRSDRGLTARLTPAAPGGVLPARSLGRLCKLREAFPAGAWQLALRDSQASRAARRAPALRRQLAALGCDVGPIVTAGAPELEQPALEVSFLAY